MKRTSPHQISEETKARQARRREERAMNGELPTMELLEAVNVVNNNIATDNHEVKVSEAKKLITAAPPEPVIVKPVVKAPKPAKEKKAVMAPVVVPTVETVAPNPWASKEE